MLTNLLTFSLFLLFTPTDERTALATKLEKMSMKAPLVVAHRGNSGEYPENTIPAFESAMVIGSDLIEFDVRVTSDGVVVCLHDDTLDRTTNAASQLESTQIRVAEIHSSQIKGLDAGYWKGERFVGTHLPTMEAALRVMDGKTIPLIERKGGDPEALLNVLRRLGVVDSVVVQSFDWDYMERLRKLEPSLMIGVLGSGEMTVDHVARALAMRAELVHWKAADLKVEDVELLRKKGFVVMAYTIDDDMGMAGAGALGVTGITTNDPARLKGLIQLGYVRTR